MAGITQAQAQSGLDKWLAASEAVANSQSYSIGGRSLSRANAKEIMKWVKFYQNILQDYESGGIKQTRVLPRDD